MVEIEIYAKGPVLEGRGPEIIQKAMPQIEEAIANDLMSLIRADLRVVLQHPTGRFQSAAPSMQRSGDTITVDDGGVIYGPWLEGVGSRNARTRFKGYSTFRRMAQEAQDRAEATVGHEISELIVRLNG